MGNENLITDMYTMIKESSEKTARIEASLSFMDSRLDKTELLLSKMSDTLNEQKAIALKVDALQKITSENEKRITALEQRHVSIFKKYFQVFITALITATAGFVAVKLGLK